MLFFEQIIKMSKSLHQEGVKAKHLLNFFNFLSEDLPGEIEADIESLKLNMIHHPINIHICGMFDLDYFVLYAVRKILQIIQRKSSKSDFILNFSDNFFCCRISNHLGAISDGWLTLLLKNCLQNFEKSCLEYIFIHIVSNAIELGNHSA